MSVESKEKSNITHRVEPVGDEDVEEPVVPFKRPPSITKRKNAVFSASEPPVAEYKIIVIPKSDAAKSKITEIIGKNFLFSKLDESQKKIIVGYYYFFLIYLK
jgi:hypothetical protein